MMDTHLVRTEASDSLFWVNRYIHYYQIGIYSLEHLKEKLRKLKSVEDEWLHHRNWLSYINCVNALELVINRIEKGEI